MEDRDIIGLFRKRSEDAINETAKKIEEIKMPEDMRIRIIGKCYAELENNKMSKRNVYNYLKKPVAAVAALALCLCVTSVTVLAATGKLQGFFKDMKRWD